VGSQWLERAGIIWISFPSSTIPPRFARMSAISKVCSPGGAINIKSASTSVTLAPPGHPARLAGGSPTFQGCRNGGSKTCELLWLRRSVTPSVRASNSLAVLGSGNKRHIVVRLSRISDKLGRSSAEPQRNTKWGANFPANGDVCKHQDNDGSRACGQAPAVRSRRDFLEPSSLREKPGAQSRPTAATRADTCSPMPVSSGPPR
jgi:hypothetical protein